MREPIASTVMPPEKDKTIVMVRPSFEIDDFLHIIEKSLPVDLSWAKQISPENISIFFEYFCWYWHFLILNSICIISSERVAKKKEKRHQRPTEPALYNQIMKKNIKQEERRWAFEKQELKRYNKNFIFSSDLFVKREYEELYKCLQEYLKSNSSTGQELQKVLNSASNKEIEKYYSHLLQRKDLECKDKSSSIRELLEEAMRTSVHLTYTIMVYWVFLEKASIIPCHSSLYIELLKAVNFAKVFFSTSIPDQISFLSEENNQIQRGGWDNKMLAELHMGPLPGLSPIPLNLPSASDLKEFKKSEISTDNKIIQTEDKMKGQEQKQEQEQKIVVSIAYEKNHKPPNLSKSTVVLGICPSFQIDPITLVVVGSEKSRPSRSQLLACKKKMEAEAEDVYFLSGMGFLYWTHLLLASVEVKKDASFIKKNEQKCLPSDNNPQASSIKQRIQEIEKVWVESELKGFPSSKVILSSEFFDNPTCQQLADRLREYRKSEKGHLMDQRISAHTKKFTDKHWNNLLERRRDLIWKYDNNVSLESAVGQYMGECTAWEMTFFVFLFFERKMNVLLSNTIDENACSLVHALIKLFSTPQLGLELSLPTDQTMSIGKLKFKGGSPPSSRSSSPSSPHRLPNLVAPQQVGIPSEAKVILAAVMGVLGEDRISHENKCLAIGAIVNKLDSQATATATATEIIKSFPPKNLESNKISSNRWSFNVNNMGVTVLVAVAGAMVGAAGYAIVKARP